MFAKKSFSIISGLSAFYSFVFGYFLLISNIQGKRVPDGHPLDPWWIVITFLVILPVILTALSIKVWTRKRGNYKIH